MIRHTIKYSETIPLSITELSVSMVQNRMEVQIIGHYSGTEKVYRFYNVSSLCLSEISPPMQISAFQMLDHSPEGWERSHTYEFLDYEEGTVHFYCESFEIL